MQPIPDTVVQTPAPRGRFNVLSRLLYRLVILPGGIYRQLGADLPQLKLILFYKLLMDDRRPGAFQQGGAGQHKKGMSNATLFTLLMSLVIGFIYLVFFHTGRDAITHLFFFFSAFLFMLASLLITDFTSVLIDVRDNSILLPRPVNDRTVLLAKVLHIVVHLSRLLLPMALPVTVFLFLRQGWAAAVALLCLMVVACGFTIFLINAVYLLVLRFTTAQRFQSIISWFQIVFAVVLYGGYQLVPRVADMEAVQRFSITDISYARLLPPFWFAAAWEFVSGQAPGRWPWFLLSLACSAGSIWLVVRFLAPAFTNRLAALPQATGHNGTDLQAAGQSLSPAYTGATAMPTSPQPLAAVVRPASLAEKLAAWFCRSRPEVAAFLFCWKWTARNREFKMKVYPTFGYLAVWFFLSFYRHFSGYTTADQLVPVFLGMIYFSSFILFNALQQVSHSSQYKASWIFWVSPLAAPGPLLLGSFKAILAKFYLPIALLLTIVGLGWIGPVILPNLVLALSNQLAICCLVVWVQHRKLPASLPPITQNKGSSFLQAIFLLLVSGLVGGGHFLLYRFLPVVSIVAVLSVIASTLLLQKIGRAGWKDIKQE